MKKLSIFLLALVTCAGTMFASDTSVDGIWYNFDDEHLTAEVTYQGDEYYSYSNEYSGEVVIPSSVTYNAQTYTVTSIGDWAFGYCTGLTSVTISNSVTSIGEFAFYGCRGLTSVTIPNSVTTIGFVAFYDCESLASVAIPSSVTSIGSQAFAKCGALLSITVTEDNAIYSSLDGVLYNKDQTYLIQFPAGKQGTCEIPSSVTSIGSNAFSGCSKVTSFSVAEDNTIYSSLDGVLYSKDKTTLVLYPQGKQGAYVIPNDVQWIAWCSFRECDGLTAVTIPNSVTGIENYAFSYCTGLTSVTNYATTPQSINSNVFDNVDKSTCVLNVPKESVSLYQAADVWKEFTNIVGVDVPGEDPEEPIETVEGDYTINYVDKDSQALYNHVVTLYVPVAPAITGFTFVGWQASGMLSDGITLQAVYQANTPTNAPAVYTNPANPAQKLIRNGNVYILTDDKTYTITGQTVK